MRKSVSIFVLLYLLIVGQVFAFEITNKNINDLKFGKTNPTVKQLQLFLNENGFYENEEGPGSPDNEDEYFGENTKAGLKIFQEYSEIPVTGKVDLVTGKAINDYIKEIEIEEAEFAKEDGDKKNSFVADVDISETYGLQDALETEYSTDIIDRYTNNPDQERNEGFSDEEVEKKEPEKKTGWTLKNLLEKTTNTFHKSKDTSPQKSSLFEKFFSIFK